MRMFPRHLDYLGKARLLFYIIVASAMVLFVLFFMVGFDRPYRPDPNFNEPTFTSVLIVYVLMIVVFAVAIALWAVVATLRRKGVGDAVVNGVLALRIAVAVAVVTLLTMAVTFLMGSTQALRVNGKVFDGSLSLKVADMFVASSAVMILLAVAAVIYGTIRSNLNNR